MTEDEELMPPTQGAVVDPVLRGDAAGSQSKRAARKRLLAEVESEWHNFPNLPGTHLSWRKVGRGSWELINDSNGAVSTRRERRRSTPRGHVFTSQGRTYAWQRVSSRWKSPAADLVNVATNAQVLRISGGHFNGRAGTRVTLTGQGEIQFPVRGTGGRALMSAIDESGNCLVEYRSVQAKRGAFWYHSTSDVAIDPNTLTTPQIELLVAVSATFLPSYFQSGGGG